MAGNGKRWTEHDQHKLPILPNAIDRPISARTDVLVTQKDVGTVKGMLQQSNPTAQSFLNSTNFAVNGADTTSGPGGRSKLASKEPAATDSHNEQNIANKKRNQEAAAADAANAGRSKSESHSASALQDNNQAYKPQALAKTGGSGMEDPTSVHTANSKSNAAPQHDVPKASGDAVQSKHPSNNEVIKTNTAENNAHSRNDDSVQNAANNIGKASTVRTGDGSVAQSTKSPASPDGSTQFAARPDHGTAQVATSIVAVSDRSKTLIIEQHDAARGGVGINGNDGANGPKRAADVAKDDRSLFGAKSEVVAESKKLDGFAAKHGQLESESGCASVKHEVHASSGNRETEHCRDNGKNAAEAKGQADKQEERAKSEIKGKAHAGENGERGDHKPTMKAEDIEGKGGRNTNNERAEGKGERNTKNENSEGKGERNTKNENAEGKGERNIKNENGEGKGERNTKNENSEGKGERNTKNENAESKGERNIKNENGEGKGERNVKNDDVQGKGERRIKGKEDAGLASDERNDGDREGRRVRRCFTERGIRDGLGERPGEGLRTMRGSRSQELIFEGEKATKVQDKVFDSLIERVNRRAEGNLIRAFEELATRINQSHVSTHSGRLADAKVRLALAAVIRALEEGPSRMDRMSDFAKAQRAAIELGSENLKTLRTILLEKSDAKEMYAALDLNRKYQFFRFINILFDTDIAKRKPAERRLDTVKDMFPSTMLDFQHTVKFGETCRWIAWKVLDDIKLAPLVAKINGLQQSPGSARAENAQLKAGAKIFLPTPNEIAKFREERREIGAAQAATASKTVVSDESVQNLLEGYHRTAPRSTSAITDTVPSKSVGKCIKCNTVHVVGASCFANTEAGGKTQTTASSKRVAEVYVMPPTFKQDSKAASGSLSA
jgi:hypothetical protein